MIPLPKLEIYQEVTFLSFEELQQVEMVTTNDYIKRAARLFMSEHQIEEIEKPFVRKLTR